MQKAKSLRQLAGELGVSHAYLSQVMHGKRPASEKVREALDMVSMVSNTEAGAGLKIRRSNPCGFESLSRHQGWDRCPG
jgi:transcriptional regulator with XRE-family HTH domain